MRLVARVVDAHHAAQDVGAAEVVDGQVGAPLVAVLEPAEALGLARLLVARQLDEDGLAVLREDDDDVALGERVGEPAEVDVGRVAVVRVPGGLGRAAERSVSSGAQTNVGREGVGWHVHSMFELALVERLDGAYLVHGGRL